MSDRARLWVGHARRLSRRAFVRQLGRLGVAGPAGLGILLGVTQSALAAPGHQDDPADPAGPSDADTPTPGTPTSEAPSTESPTTGTAATATSTATPASTPTVTPTAPAGLTRETVLSTLRLTHPRLMLLADDQDRIRRLLTSDATARAYRDALLRNGSRLLTQPPPERVLIGPRLLAVSRTVLERVTTLGLLHRIDGDPRWSARARTELMAAAGFSDWNPSHFLDVAELCHAFAIGYDWMYETLTPADRTTLRRALIDKGLQPAQQEYSNGTPWTRATHNWNIVCNGGIAMAALAIGDEEPGLAGTLLAQALSSLPRAVASYAPDGAWIEGPSYWEYATRYLAATLASLTGALGTTFGLDDADGLSQTGRFRLYVTGPTGQFFNFADAPPRADDEPTLFWLARRYDDPALAQAARDAASLGSSARDLLWYDPRGTPADIAALPLDAHYDATQLVFFRSAWNDKDALYLAFKGGNNAANHAHLDLGTFVFDALGQRWAMDLGPDDYNLPGYFGAERWTYERLKTSGQNTLVLDGTNQDSKATALVAAFRSSPESGFAILDLTDAYAASGATRVLRGAALRDGRSRVMIQDEIETSLPVDLTWTIHTQATVDVSDGRATLSQGGQVLDARILVPADAAFAVEDLVISPPQQPAPGVRRLMIRLPGITSARLVVLLTPRGRGASAPGATGTAGAAAPPDAQPPPEIVPLDRWALASTLGWQGS